MASFDSFLPARLSSAPATAAPLPQATPPSLPAPQSRRPLVREGAMFILSAAEQAMADAMARSSPVPEPVLGKRTHEAGEQTDDDDDDEPNDEPPSAMVPQSSLPCSTNLAAATLRYAAKKKLRPEQRDEVDAFLLVGSSSL